MLASIPRAPFGSRVGRSVGGRVGPVGAAAAGGVGRGCAGASVVAPGQHDHGMPWVPDPIPAHIAAEWRAGVRAVLDAVTSWQSGLPRDHQQRHQLATIGQHRRGCAVCRVHLAAELVDEDIRRAVSLAVDVYTGVAAVTAAVEALRRAVFHRPEYISDNTDPGNAVRFSSPP